MKKKRETCKYCDEKMDAKTTRKEFCSIKCRVYWHRDNEIVKTQPKEEKKKYGEEKKDLSEKKKDLTEVKKYPAPDPKEGSMAFYNKYGAATYAEAEKLKK